jgi:hypothetical protein
MQLKNTLMRDAIGQVGIYELWFLFGFLDLLLFLGFGEMKEKQTLLPQLHF